MRKAEEAAFRAMKIGDRIRWLIEARGYSQVEVAAKCGVTQAAISNLVTDASRKPNAFTLLRLADALDADPGWILYGEGHYDRRPPPERRDEAALLQAYRSMSKPQRQGLLDLLGIKP